MAIRLVFALAVAAFAVSSATSPALGAKPTTPHVVGGGPADDQPWMPPSPAEQALIDRKVAIAAKVEASSAASSRGVLPRSTCAGPGGMAATSSTAGCVYVPSSFALSTYARRQNNSYYCGPATAQVIINGSRGFYFSNTDGEARASNYRGQSYIASRLLWYNGAQGRWENTDTIGSTNAYMLTNGLNELAALPSGFAYAVVKTGTGSEWHSKVITDTYHWKMAFGTSVKMTSTSSRLSSWRPISAGLVVLHWITIRGYSGFWDGTSGPKVYFNDSSGSLGGGTGSYSDASLKVYQLNAWNAGILVW